MADLFAFRFRSQHLGAAVVGMVVGLLPYLAVQLRSVAHTTQLLLPAADTRFTAALFVAIMLIFAMLFGARHAATRERHPGLVNAIALESVVKALALLAVGLAVLVSFPNLSTPASTERMLEPVRSGAFVSVLLLSIPATFLLPRQFHMAFNEAPEGDEGERALRTATSAFRSSCW